MRVTFRPEFVAPGIGRSHATAVIINRLGQREAGTVIDRIAGDKLPPTSIRHDSVARSDRVQPVH